MLEIKNIKKIYKTLDLTQKALDNVSVKFRTNEFVSILGQSGSGKTTLLNIIGGLDKYTEGDLIINGISTKQYKDRDWDTYRNHSVGFVFQSYNLIPHQSILANVELALTLSGISKKQRRKKSIEVLKKVGLKNQIHKKPNQLSGGQMQRVAIARALVNEPEILLADEPTGALDSKTSIQIMDLLKEVAKDRLVIMVTHNPDLANEYSTRIIKLADGKIIDDSNPFDNNDKKVNHKEKIKKSKMNFRTALSLSLNNLMTKKGRTILTSLAGSIGIIGIALILSLSSGVNKYIKSQEENTLSSYPLSIEKESVDTAALMTSMMGINTKNKTYNDDKIHSDNILTNMFETLSEGTNINNLKKLKDYLENNKEIKEYSNDISYSYDIDLQIYKSNTKDGIVKANPATVYDSMGYTFDSSAASFMSSYSSLNVFTQLSSNKELLKEEYDVVAGKLPTKYNEVILKTDKDGKVSDYTLYALGLLDQDELKDMIKDVEKGKKVKSKETSYTYDDILNLKYKLVLNTDYYKKENGIYIDKSSDDDYLKKLIKKSQTINVVGIIKPKKATNITTTGEICYTEDLINHVTKQINKTDIVKKQKKNKKTNVFTGLKFNETKDISNLSIEEKQYLSTLSQDELATVMENYNSSYETNEQKLGIVDLENPDKIDIYPIDFSSKEKIEDIIKDYNSNQKEKDKINYSDTVGAMMTSVTSIVNIISYVLIAFVSISLIVSSIMIGIITYISVLERIKEIGILRAMGASKKDISRVFNAETLIEGFISGTIGIIITLLLNIPINIIIEDIAGVSNISVLPVTGAIVLIIISMLLTFIAGLIPSKIASKKDPVICLRSE